VPLRGGAFIHSSSGAANVNSSFPTGTKPLGGGGLSNAGLVLVNLNSTTLNGRSWLVIENNASTFSATVTAIAICGKLPGYAVVTGTNTLNPPGSRTATQVSCPIGTLPIGGGVFSTSFSLAVNVNTSVPSGGEWESFENNAGPTPGFTSTTAICAGK